MATVLFLCHDFLWAALRKALKGSFVIDEFRIGSLLLDQLTFDDAVSPGTGVSTMTYGYIQLLTPATVGFCAINTEHTPNEAKRAKKTADLKIFGGSAQVGRVIQSIFGAINEIEFQTHRRT